MILLPILLIIGVTITTLSEPAPVTKTTKEIYQEGIGYKK
jgi:hypothetical protein